MINVGTAPRVVDCGWGFGGGEGGKRGEGEGGAFARELASIKE